MFQKNAANFYGTDTPNVGERPFKVPKTIPQGAAEGGRSILNERRLHEHEMQMANDPNYKKNQKRFFGVPSHHTVQRSNPSVASVAQKLD